jgi:hypothetical protein
LAPAIVRGEDVEIDARISKRLLGNLPQTQRIYSVFAPSFGHEPHQIGVTAREEGTSEYRDNAGAAAFFTGGVDSLYTVLTHREELSALIFLHGLDIQTDSGAFEKVSQGVRRAAEALGLPLIEVETNAKTFADRFVHWDLYSGAPLVATALLLQNHFRKFYIAGGRSIARLFANGSHPLLDPLWGTESVDFVHDAYAERLEKLEYLAHSEVAQKYLRVCFYNRGDAYNCCECLKCLWVMSTLKAYGVLDRFQTFEKPLDLDRLAHLDLQDPNLRMVAETNARTFAKKGVDPDLLAALQTMIRAWNPDFGQEGDDLGKWFANAWPGAEDR